MITDYFVICSGQTNRQVQTIANNVEERLREHKVKKLRLESDKQGNWILIDFGAVVVHILTQEQRDYYQLERLWSDAPHRKWEVVKGT